MLGLFFFYSEFSLTKNIFRNFGLPCKCPIFRGANFVFQVANTFSGLRAFKQLKTKPLTIFCEAQTLTESETN